LELLAQARELTARTKDNYRHLLATWFVEVISDDPHAAIRALPDLVEQARSTGLRLILVQRGRDLFRPMATFGRYDAVAILDGASRPISIRPTWAAEAVNSAREALGEEEYAHLYDKGHSFSPADLEEYLLQLAAELS
jgi:hypothetical protein